MKNIKYKVGMKLRYDYYNSIYYNKIAIIKKINYDMLFNLTSYQLQFENDKTFNLASLYNFKILNQDNNIICKKQNAIKE